MSYDPNFDPRLDPNYDGTLLGRFDPNHQLTLAADDHDAGCPSDCPATRAADKILGGGDRG